MSAGATYAGDVSCIEAWNVLKSDETALLIDVRTQAEWAFVGVPVLTEVGTEPILIEWQSFPTMARNMDFDRLVMQAVAQQGGDKQSKLFFLCRSGARSQSAAILMSEQGFPNCFNVADGFEGPLSPDRRRGTTGGWKSLGLPWAQS